MDNDDDIRLSRALIGGKKIDKIEARVSYELKEALRRKWVDEGFNSESEYLEMLVSVNVFGADHVQSVLDRRLRAVGLVSDKGRSS